MIPRDFATVPRTDVYQLGSDVRVRVEHCGGIWGYTLWHGPACLGGAKDYTWGPAEAFAIARRALDIYEHTLIPGGTHEPLSASI